MRIAFYAPLKSPNHPVPSGDRLMARLLIRVLEVAGHSVEVVSEFRAYAATPEIAAAMEPGIATELDRLRNQWSGTERPELWFSYHTYYKSPDRFGPILSAEFGIPYVTAEASYSRRRDADGWAAAQSHVGVAIAQAAVNISFTERDRAGMADVFPDAHFAPLKPFIDTAHYEPLSPAPDPKQLIAVAMMRSGDKMQSYRMLAAALERIRDQPWTLAIVGDGPMRAEVETLFSRFAPKRILWLGERGAEEIAALLNQAGIYVWPGCGEAYGLAYLEAQAAGLPVVAQHTAGVPSVVEAGMTGLLTPEGDVDAYAAAIVELLEGGARRDSLAAAARRFVLEERSLAGAAMALDAILRAHVRITA